MSAFTVIDPATGTKHAQYPAATDAEVEAGLTAAQATYQDWSRTTTVAERAALAKRLAELFVERKDKLAAIINREMGKPPLAQAAGEAEFSGSIAAAFAEHAEEWLADEDLEVADGLRTFFRYQGLGVVLASCRGTTRTIRWHASRFPTSSWATP